MSNFFNYSRTLPYPFDSLKSKVVKVSSKYGDGTNAKLTSTVVKAVMAYYECQQGESGAVGLIDHRTVAEYKSSTGPDAYHLVVYDPGKGQFLAGCYNKSTEMIEQYVAHSSARDGAALVFAMMPLLLADDEFKENYEAYKVCHSKGWPDVSVATEYMAILCDNAYRRIKDETCSAHLKVTLDKSGNVLPIRSAQLDAGTFKPTTVSAGEFIIFASGGGPAPVTRPVSVVEHKDFLGQYSLNPSRTLTPLEQSMVPVIPDWHILTKEVVDICKHIQHSTGTASPMRNFLLRGPAGTGKTHDARAIAAGLGLPYVKYTCSADSDIFDFIGQVYPEFGTSTGDPATDTELKKLEQMGGISYGNVKALLDLPDAMDMDFDPESAYLSMTGAAKPGATVHDCMDAAFHLVTDKVQKLSAAKSASSSDGPRYNYFETDFILGLKNGYLVELQEPANITQPSVLTGLNDLLEQSGTILLPDKRRIKRHPDAVVIITTNVTYEGCRPLNQSVLDRMNLIKDIPLPAPEIMAQRAMSVTGCEDEHLVTQMVQVISDMADYCQNHAVSDGNVGMRGLIDWIVSYGCTGNAYASALDTIVSRATADMEEQHALVTSHLEPYFAPNGAVVGAK